MAKHPLPFKVIWRAAFPLLTEEIEQDLKALKMASSTAELNEQHILELLKAHPYHFDQVVNSSALPIASRGVILFGRDGEYAIYQRDVEQVHNYINTSVEYALDLSSMPWNEALERYNKIVGEQRALDRAETRQLDSRRFFSLPHAELDDETWLRWSKMAAWTNEEATALSFGKDPDVVSSSSVDEVLLTSQDKRSLFRDEYSWRSRLLKRAIEAGTLSSRPSPDQYAEWATRAIKGLHERLLVTPHAPNNEVAYQKLVAENLQLKKEIAAFEATVDNMDPKARNTLRLLLLVMATKKYGYRFQQRTSATTNIINECADLGIKITDKTVKGILDDAAADPSLADKVGRMRKVLKAQ